LNFVFHTSKRNKHDPKVKKTEVHPLSRLALNMGGSQIHHDHGIHHGSLHHEERNRRRRSHHRGHRKDRRDRRNRHGLP